MLCWRCNRWTAHSRGLLIQEIPPSARCAPAHRCGVHLPTVLIVDDHATARAAARKLFETCVISVVCAEAENGVEAVAKAQQLTPDLIVLDLSMPVMNGFEAAKIFRELFPAIPIFMLTAHYIAA